MSDPNTVYAIPVMPEVEKFNELPIASDALDPRGMYEYAYQKPLGSD